MSLTLDYSPTESSTALFDFLPNPALGSTDDCPRRAKLEIDALLIAIEALELGGTEDLLSAAKTLNLDNIIKHRIALWRIRSTNPMRRAHTRRKLSMAEAKALTLICCHLSRKLTVKIRQLLIAHQQLSQKAIPPEYNFALSQYLDNFRANFRARMNPRRALVSRYQDDDALNEYAIVLLNKLIFCTGTMGEKRLWTSLFDGEVK
jgi:hypothetical protein